MTQIQIKSSDVIRLILQFLHQNSKSQVDLVLYRTFETLQEESKITLNTMPAKQLAKLIDNNQWDILLEKLNMLMLSEQNLFSLNEMIIDDLIEKNKFNAAQFVLNNCIPKALTSKYRERVLRIQYICENPSQKDLYKKPVTSHRKQQLTRKLVKDIHQQPQPSRLLTLLAQSIKYQVNEGLLKPNIKTSLYQNKQFNLQAQPQSVIKHIEKTIQYSSESKVSALAFSNSGEYLAIGSVDGLIQIYDTIEYQLHNRLTYQAEGIMMYHQNAINNVVFNEGDEMLMSSDCGGVVKVWGVQNGKLLRKVVEQQGKVSVISWGIDPSHIILANQKISLYGLRSSLLLKEYNVNNDNEFIVGLLIKNYHIITATTRCTLKIFHYNTQEELFSVKINKEFVEMIGLKNDIILLCTRTVIIKFTYGLEELQKYPIDVSSLTNAELLQCCAVDKYAYECLKGNDKNYRMNVRDINTNKVVFYCSTSGINLMVVHPRRNLLVTYDESQQLQFWRSE